MKKWLVLGLLVLAMIAAMFGTIKLTTRLFLTKENILRIDEIPMDFKVDNYIGFVTDPDALHFGTIPPGNSGERFISLGNGNKFPVKIDVTFDGEAGKYAWAETWTEPDFVLSAGEGKNISIKIFVPKYLPHGNYTGTAYFTFREARE